jgi:hypothetical protein
MKDIYVKAPRGAAVHIFTGAKVEGNPTLCGRWMRIGWKWSTSIRSKEFKNLNYCQGCFMPSGAPNG